MKGGRIAEAGRTNKSGQLSAAKWLLTYKLCGFCRAMCYFPQMDWLGPLCRPVLGCFLGLFGSAVLAAPDLPPGAEALEQRLLSKYSSSMQAWIREQARNFVSSGHISEGRARVIVANARLVPGGDADDMTFLFLMQAVRDANADLEGVMRQSQQEWATQDELSAITHSRAPTPVQISPGQQAALQLRPRGGTVMKWHSTEAPPPDANPRADVDLSVRLDLQTAMDRESATEEALAAAMKRLPGQMP